MDNFISILRDSNSPAELEELKVQLFRENVRIKTDKADLEELKESCRGQLIGMYIESFEGHERSPVEEKALQYGLEALLAGRS